MRKLNIFNFNWFEFALIGIVTVCTLIFFIQDITLLGFIDFAAAITGIMSVVLCAKGKRSGFIFGLINVICYATVAFTNLYYGEVMLNVFFYIPMNIVSYMLWTRHMSKQEHIADARRLSLPTIFIGAAAILGVTFLYHLFLTSLGGALTYLDGMTTILSIVATILMMLRYSEQWLAWTIIDAITVIMWIVAADPIMSIMWGAYLVNAVYGYILWTKRSQNEREELALAA